MCQVSSKRANTLVFLIMMMSCLGSYMQAWLGQSSMTGSAYTSWHAVGSDDAYISYRYAYNLFHGDGLVFNPHERVEGYSNLLYTLFITPIFFFHANWVYPYSVLLNSLFLALTLYLFYGFLNQTLGQRKALFGTALLGLCPYLWVNAATGLETSLILTITVAAWIALEGYLNTQDNALFIKILLLSLLSLLARIDGFILPLSMALYLLLKNKKKSALQLMLFLLVCASVYTAWRLFYYQDFIGNPYYAKISGPFLTRLNYGWFYIAKEMVRTGLWLPLLVLIASFLQNLIKKRFITLDFSELFFLLWIGYLSCIGGDIYHERFMIVLMPMGIYILMNKLPVTDYGKPISLLFFLAIMLTQWIIVPFDSRFKYQYPKYDCLIATGKFLKKNYPHAYLAVDAAGKIPYFSQLITLDMLGLNDKVIAKMPAHTAGYFCPGHIKYDAKYVLSKNPDLIVALTDPDSNLDYGLKKNLYQQKYILTYLVNATRHDLGSNNIIDVTHFPSRRVKQYIASGYIHAILVKKSLNTYSKS